MAIQYNEPGVVEPATYRKVPNHFRNLMLVSLGAAMLFSAVCISELNNGVQNFKQKCAYIQARAAQM